MEQQLQTAELEGHSDSQLLLSLSIQRPGHTDPRGATGHIICEREAFIRICCYRRMGGGLITFRFIKNAHEPEEKKNKIISALTRLLTSFSSAPPSVELGSIFFAERKGAS